MRQAPTTTTTHAHLGTSLDNRAARKAGDEEARNERAAHEHGDVDDAEKLDPHTLLLHLQTHMPSSADRDADPDTSESNSDKDDEEMVSYSEDEDPEVPSRRDADDDTAGDGGKGAKRARGGAKRRRADEEGEGDDSAGAPPTPRRSGGICFDFSCQF
jgi:hypothetical protein